MPTSSEPPKGNRWMRRAGAALLFVAIAVALDVALTFVLQSYGMTHEVIWYDYRRTEKGTLDTLVVGSSYASFGVDPTAIDEVLGSSTYNLATMAQTLPNSLACVNTVRKDHPLRRVVLCFGPSSLQMTPQYDREVLFMQAKSLGEPLPDVLQNVAAVALDDENFPKSKSLTWMFPWVYDMVDLNVDAIAANVGNRLATSNPIEVMPTHDDRWRYVGRGHCAYEDGFDYSTLVEDDLLIDTDESFLPKNTSELCDLLDACADKDIATYVVIAPHPSYANLVHRLDGYADLMAGLQGLAQEHGATYMDFNLTMPEFYRSVSTDYQDPEHLNLEGSIRFSSALGSAIAAIEGGEDVGERFFAYDQWDEYLASYEKVALCYCDVEEHDGTARLEAGAVTRPGIDVEYRFEAWNYDVGDFVVVRDFAPSRTFETTVPEEGVDLRITARAAGSTEDADSYACYKQLESR